MENQRGFLPRHGNYQELKAFQKAEVVYDLTMRFARKYLSRGDRTIDQMVQAARSGKKNLLEGSKASKTSKEMEIKLTNVARASLEEVLDDSLDYLRSRELHHHAEGPTPDFPALTLIWADTCATQCPEAAKKPIGDFMAKVPARLKADDPITKAAYLMVIHDTSMLPVVDSDRLVGVARVIDVFNEAAETVLHD
jgi:four helix bundle protein